MKTVSSKIWKYMFAINWCVKCGEMTNMKHVNTHMPGINAAQCSVCNTGIQVNYLEECGDLEVPDEFIIVPDDFCPHCKMITEFKYAIIEDNCNLLHDGKVCKQCGLTIADFGDEIAMRIQGKSHFE